MTQKITQKTRNNKSIDAMYIGSEPIVEEINGRGDSRLIGILGWYNYTHDSSSAKNWILQWMKMVKKDKGLIDQIRALSDRRVVTTVGWLAKMALNGTKLAKDNIQYMDERILEMVSEANAKNDEDDDVVKEKRKVDLQARTLHKNNQIHAAAEAEVIDDQTHTMYEFLKKYQCTPAAANFLKAKYQPCFDEVFDNDPQVKEAYGKSLKKWQAFYKTLIEDIDRYVGNKKVTKVRKPREVKQKPISKLVEKVKYQKEFPSLKIVSILPQEIIGAQSLWTYNTKYKQLTVYHAMGPDGFGIKGTTITGFDPAKSITKALRKPEVHTKEVLDAGRVAIKKIMDNIKTAGREPNGRINENTILLRVGK